MREPCLESVNPSPARDTRARSLDLECYYGDVMSKTGETAPSPPQDDAAAAPFEPWSPGPGEDDDPLIFWMLSLTPNQRLEVAQDFVDSILALRRGRRA